MVGIYIIKNKINNKVYIGQSINIKNRWKGHIKASKTNDSHLYRAIRKYGLENFDFDVLEECSKEYLDEKENYYILKYNSNNSDFGYNNTTGYDFAQYGMSEENHPNHKLTKEDVYYIRECYNNHMEKDEVYEEFKDIINKNGFSKIWNNITWTRVHQDVYTEENKQYYLFKRNSHLGSKNGRAKLTENDVYQIRLRRKNGEKCFEVYKDYESFEISYGSFKNVWSYMNWKNIVV